ncbi:HAMP domain-containing sensor histidine kinase [Flavobacterium sp.]|uniref:sensor histidine kinase n=1 Tax=Flavobacterium sp. TaxID=239 RepID=UPI0012049A7E|nr:HAMP domain-containing sensor histidine kinase [Flavobacterium sp.]RZJ73964.1 MAG: HAMP domain-containing histidine kinase [Flavobacterium sp.]
MKKSVIWAICLMTVCVIGISALQLFYSVRSFESEQKAFSRNANEAFRASVDSTFSIRTNQVVMQFRNWVSDTGFVKITCKVNPAYGTTVFTMKEVDPSKKGQTQISLSIEDFTEKVLSITPKARAVFIDHIVKMAKADLEKNYVFYYTQKLGDSLNEARFKTPIDTAIVRRELKRELSKRGISLDFTLNPKKDKPDSFKTENVNIEIKSNKMPRLVHATFSNADLFVFSQLKWAIFGSAILLLLPIFCFGYALRLLLSQEKLSKIKDDFINNMTHEIHTPLASIVVTAEALRKFDHDEQSRGHYLDIILHQSKRLDALSSEILDSARFEKNGVVSKKRFLVRPMLLEAVLGIDSVQVSVDSIPDDFWIVGNKELFERAIRNLLDNSLKYAVSDNVQIGLSAKIESKKLLISVSDNGQGIPNHEKSRIFDAFYRIPSQTHEVKGYGLGLHLVRQVVENHGGTISVKDNFPSGSIFETALPI